MKRIIYLIIPVFLTIACQEKLEDRCAREAKEYTQKKCPSPVGKNTIIDSMIFYRPTLTIHYYYTLTGDADNQEAIKNTADLRERLLEQVKNTTSMKEYKDAGYNIAYTYFSQKDKGKILFDVIFTKNDYK